MGIFLFKVVLVTQLIYHFKVTAQSCNFYEELLFGKEYVIYSPGYPRNYSAGVECFWDLRTVAGTKILLSCNDVALPESPNCNADRLAISLTGRRDFADSDNYCGKGSFSLISIGAALTIGLKASPYSQGGRFFCSVTPIFDNDTSSSQSPNDFASCDCGWNSMTRIVGGQDAKLHEFPFMSALVLNGQLLCGANIISDRFALSAAHCVARKNVLDILLLVGDHNINTGNDTNDSALYRISAYEIHPSYQETTQKNDIAILRTATVIIFSPNVGPICLPFKYTTQSFAGQIVLLLGWGQLEFSGRLSDILQKADVKVLTNQQCSTMQSEVLSDGEICTFSDQGKDSCQSDSGGPVVWRDPGANRYQLVGVTSHGVACGTSSPAINTRVTQYLQWIVGRTGASYCIV